MFFHCAWSDPFTELFMHCPVVVLHVPVVHGPHVIVPVHPLFHVPHVLFSCVHVFGVHAAALFVVVHFPFAHPVVQLLYMYLTVPLTQ